MRAPFRGRDLVFDQGIHCFGIRYAQQRLGQTHQGHAFLRREAIFRQKDLHQTGAGIGAHGFDHLCATLRRGFARRGGGAIVCDQSVQNDIFIFQMIGTNAGADIGKFGHFGTFP